MSQDTLCPLGVIQPETSTAALWLLGLSLGAGLTWDFTPNLSAVLEWDRYDFRFAGTGRDAVHATSVGLQYRY